MKRTTKRITALAFSIVMAGALAACDDAAQAEGEKEEIGASEQDAKENVDASESAYEDAYPTARAYLIDNYGITETAELCDKQNDFSDDADFDSFIKDLMDGAGIEVEGESRSESPEFRGAFDATDDALYDICNPE